MTFSELKNDIDFLDGLCNEEFILILGAGFSYGVPNKSNTDCKTIPLGGRFLEITNKKFDENISKYSIASGLWKESADSDENIGEEFKTLFLADENQFDHENFERVFIPNWANIYTFNFDNVLDLAQRNIPEKYKIFSYPNDPTNSQKSISHLHGKITDDFKFDDIVFSPDDYIRSDKRKHDLYTSFHGEVKTFNKNLVIIGTQFTEQAVLSKFFDGLEDKHIKIYHFEFVNRDTKALSQFKNNDYKFIQLSEGVTEIFDFFEENNHIIRKYDFDGAKVIDKAFIADIEDKSFSKNDFFISKLSNDCQWYGCNNEWGIKRAFYTELKQTVISSFENELSSNVAAVVHGMGGSGKSTQLRILALELHNEKFKTIWIENFNSFKEKPIYLIESSPSQNFLIIIEDWYRLSSMYKESIMEVFNRLSTLSNVRIVVGDRTLRSIYINKLYNSEKAKFEILPAENKDIVEKIANKIPEWKSVCIDLYQNEGIQNTSLFSVLFIIANVFDKELSSESIRLLDIKGHFIEIVQSDVKKISKTYAGLAKAIVYLANVYELYKIRITKKALLTIAYHFNPNANLSLLNINSTDTAIDRLISNYITRVNLQSKNEETNKIDFIQFNHDTLAEDGLSKSILDDWQPFNDQAQLKLLDILTDLKDDYSASAYLYYLLKDRKSFFKKNIELKLKYVNKLLSQNRLELFFLQSIFQKHSNFKFKIRKEFAIQILNRYKTDFIGKEIVSNCLSILTNEIEGKDFALLILKRFETEAIPKEVISNCLNILLKEPEGKTYAIQILKRFEIERVPKEIISNCLNILIKESEGKESAIQILKRFESEPVAKEIISNCLGILTKESEGKEFAIQILNRFETEPLPSNIICSCLSLLLNEQEGKGIAIRILKRFETEQISSNIIGGCLSILSNEKEGKKFAIQILKKFETENVLHNAICNSLSILSKQPEGREYAIQILNRYETENISPAIISNCLSNLAKKAEGKTFAIKILKRYKTETIAKEIISNCLRILLNAKEGKEFAIQILEKFEAEHFNNEDIVNEIISNSLSILANESEGEKFAIQILKRFETEKISPDIICKCLNILLEELEGKNFAIQILIRYQTEKISKEVVSNCLNILLKEEEGKEFAIQILKRFETQKITPDIISNCLSILTDEEEGKYFAIQILKKYETRNVDFQIISTCLNILMYEEEGKYFAIQILKRYETKKIDFQIISTCLIVLLYETEGKEFALQILKRFETKKVDFQVICTCLNVLLYEEEGKEYAIQILKRNEKEKISSAIICRCMQILKKDLSLLPISTAYLNEENYNNNFSIIYHALANYSHFKQDHEYVNRIINENRKSIKGAKYKYQELLKIPFFFNKKWRNEVSQIRKNWRNTNRSIVANILYASFDKPNFSIHLSKHILNRWKQEIEYKLKKSLVVDFDYIVNALDHPDLNIDFIELKIKEILKFNADRNNVLPSSFIKALNEIQKDLSD